MFSSADPSSAVRLVQRATQQMTEAMTTFDCSEKTPADLATLQKTQAIVKRCLDEGQEWRQAQDWVVEVLDRPPEERECVQADLENIQTFDHQGLPRLADALKAGAQVLKALVPEGLPTPAECIDRLERLEARLQQPLPIGDAAYQALSKNYCVLAQEARKTVDELKLILSKAPSDTSLYGQSTLSELERAWKDRRTHVERALQSFDDFPQRIDQAIEEIEQRICERDGAEEPLLQGETWQPPSSSDAHSLREGLLTLQNETAQMLELSSQLQQPPSSSKASRVLACAQFRREIQQVQENVSQVLLRFNDLLQGYSAGPNPGRDRLLNLLEGYQDVNKQLGEMSKKIDCRIAELRGTAT